MRKLLATLLTISLNAYAIPPVSVDSEVTAVGNYVQNVKLPNEQATQLTSRNTRVETGNTNLLKNPSFEHMTTGLGWTTTNATSALETSAVVDGKKSLKLTLSGALTATQDSSINAANLVGLQGVASIKIKSSNVSGLKVCARNAGVTSTSLCVNVTADGTWKHVSIPFIMTATSNGIAITSTGTSGIVYIDDAFVGTSAPFQGVSGAKLLGTVTITGCAGAWTNSSATYSSFGTQTGCIYTVTGQAQAPSTNIPAIKFASIDPGDLRVEFEGQLGTNSSTKDVFFQFTDGTNVARENSVVNLNVATGNLYFNGINQSISYSTKQSNVTLELKSKQASSSGALAYGTNAQPAVIKVWYFPPESRIYSQSNMQVKPLAFTPTMTGGASFSDEGTFWHREGKFMVVRGTGVITTPNASAFSVQLPTINGVQAQIDSSVQASTTNTNSVGVLYNPSGTVSSAFATTSRGPWPAFTDTAVSNSIVYFSNAVNGSRFDKTSGTTMFANGDRYRFEFKVPIVGWDQYDIVGSFAGIEKCANDYECTDEFSAQISATGNKSNENIPWLSGNCTVSSGVYTCPLLLYLKDGTNGLSSTLNCTANAIGTTRIIHYTLGSSSTSQVVFTETDPSVLKNDVGMSISCTKGTNDYKPKTAKVATSIGVPTVPGITTTGTGNLIDTFSFSYGTTNATTVCSASPCSYLDQIGTAVTSVTRSGAGAYTMNLSKTYLKLKCSFTMNNGGSSSIHLAGGAPSCTNCNALSFNTALENNVATDSLGTVDCKGAY